MPTCIRELKTKAWEEVESCCNSLCSSWRIEDYIKKLEEKVSRMITIYGKADCVYCTKAIQYCVDNKIVFTYNKLGVDYAIEFIQETFPTARQFPVVLLNDEYIGGFQELKDKGDNNEF